MVFDSDSHSDGPSKNPLITTYPYTVNRGYPQWNTDKTDSGNKYTGIGANCARLPEVDTAAQENAKELKRLGSYGSRDIGIDPVNIATKKLKKRRDSSGNVVPMPGLTKEDLELQKKCGSKEDLQEAIGHIRFTGKNFTPVHPQILANAKPGKRLARTWDNISSYQASSWTTRIAEYGSVHDPNVYKEKRHANPSFETRRYIPDHPHWEDRTFKAELFYKDNDGATIHARNKHMPTPQSTLSDLGSYYNYDQTGAAGNRYQLPGIFKYNKRLTKEDIMGPDERRVW